MANKTGINNISVHPVNNIQHSYKLQARCHFHKHFTRMTYGHSILKTLHGSSCALDDSTAYFARTVSLVHEMLKSTTDQFQLAGSILKQTSSFAAIQWVGLMLTNFSFRLYMILWVKLYLCTKQFTSQKDLHSYNYPSKHFDLRQISFICFGIGLQLLFTSMICWRLLFPDWVHAKNN